MKLLTMGLKKKQKIKSKKQRKKIQVWFKCQSSAEKRERLRG